VIDVHRREAALVVMRVPEGKLLAPMRRNERIVDVEHLNLARRHRRAELIDHSQSEPRRLDLARRILQPGNGRLRRQRLSALRTAADRELHQGIVPQPVKVVRVFVSARDRGHARHQHLAHRMLDAIRIAAIRHRCCKPLAHTKLALRLAQHQQPGIGGLIASVEIYCDFLAVNGWQVEGKRRIFGHGGCGALRLHKQFDSTPICYVNRALRATVAAKYQQMMNYPG
jgi:hypothetical protein